MTKLLPFVLGLAIAGAAAAGPMQPQSPSRPGAPAAQPPAGQAPPAGQPPAKPPAQPAPRPRAQASSARGSVTLFITDPQGAPVREARVTVTGPVDREGTANREGVVKLQGLKAGTYRVRFEAPDFVTFEREIVMRGAAQEIEVTLNKGKPEPVPQPPPAPAQPPQEAAVAPDPNARATVVSLPDFIEKTKFAAEGSPVGSAAAGGAWVLEVDQAKERSHDNGDEFLYVIAGQGMFRSKGREQAVDAGTLVLVPRGVAYTIAPRGKKAMYVLSVLTGRPK